MTITEHNKEMHIILLELFFELMKIKKLITMDNFIILNNNLSVLQWHFQNVLIQYKKERGE